MQQPNPPEASATERTSTLDRAVAARWDFPVLAANLEVATFCGPAASLEALPDRPQWHEREVAPGWYLATRVKLTS